MWATDHWLLRVAPQCESDGAAAEHLILPLPVNTY